MIRHTTLLELYQAVVSDSLSSSDEDEEKNFPASECSLPLNDPYDDEGKKKLNNLQFPGLVNYCNNYSSTSRYCCFSFFPEFVRKRKRALGIFCQGQVY